ncbi:MAG: hypothetical protein JW855_05990 [Gammaproteobacteria bacterium]|nr:hypothetical protein [Gammaproteobacteria bacterium]
MPSTRRLNLSRSIIHHKLRELALFNGIVDLNIDWKRTENSDPTYQLIISRNKRVKQFQLKFDDMISYPYGSKAAKIHGIMRKIVQYFS